ncbi:VOC family protein [Bosea beijingensis]|jgi:catechol 2,3-dioxygenase-like lactoylglutathione lyase family enzyme
MPLSIDHIVIAVADLDAAVRDYTALGFTVLPGGEHPRGSRNALVVFEDGAYLEIIAFPRPVPDFRWWQVLDRAGPGLVDFAVLPDDLDADLARARAAGIVMEGPIDGGRLQPDGTRIAWRSARPPEPDIPFLVADVTPRELRVPTGAARRHANGVTGVACVSVVVEDFSVSVARYRTLFGKEPFATGSRSSRRAESALFSTGSQTLGLSEASGSDNAELAEHLANRGQGVSSVAFQGRNFVTLDHRLSHGARLSIARDI